MEKIKKILLWIDPNIFGEENQIFLEKIKNTFNYFINIYTYTDVDDGINKLKEIKFIPTILIISGRLYPEFILFYRYNLKEYNLILETIIFTSSKTDYLNKNKDNTDMMLNDSYFNIGGVIDEFEELLSFLKEEKYENKLIKIPEQNNINLEERENDFIYEMINSKNQLICPIFYNQIFNKSNDESNTNFLRLIISKYSNDNNEIKKIITPLLKFSKIPIEILCKFFLKIYSLKTNFVNEMKKK